MVVIVLAPSYLHDSPPERASPSLILEPHFPSLYDSQVSGVDPSTVSAGNGNWTSFPFLPRWFAGSEGSDLIIGDPHGGAAASLQLLGLWVMQQENGPVAGGASTASWDCARIESVHR